MTLTPHDRDRLTVGISEDRRGLRVRICGAMDLAAEQVLTEAVREVTARPTSAVYVDVTQVTFAGATLLNFLAQVGNGIPEGTTLRVGGPTPMIRELLAVASLDDITVG